MKGPKGLKLLYKILDANKQFLKRVNINKMSSQRNPGPHAVLTCMDPRINLESIGILPFSEGGKLYSQERIIRTLGAIAEYRSLFVGIYLAGFKELTVLMHTDCGNSLAYQKIDTAIENMKKRLDRKKFDEFRDSIGEPFRERLIEWLGAFQDPREAVKNEVEAIKGHPLVPADLLVHGLVYDISPGKVEVIVDGHKA